MTKFRLVAAGRQPRTIQSETEVTIADVVSQFELYEMNMFLNGTQVNREAYTATVVPDGAQIMGTVPTKGA